MRCLVSGSTGFVGKVLVAKLLQQNHTVVEAGRRHTKNPLTTFVEVGDLCSETDWSLALEGCTTVYHLAARVHVMNESAQDTLDVFLKVNFYATVNFARQAAQAGVKRFVYVSTIKVSGEQTSVNMPFTEEGEPHPQDAYSVSKFRAEQELLEIAEETGMEVVVIRPPLVYGPGVKANFASLGNAIKHGLPLPLGAIYNKRSFIFVGNLVDFILRCTEHPAAANQIFMVSDGEDLSTTDLLKLCGRALNKKVWLLPIPQILIEKLAVFIGKKKLAQRLCGNLQVDISKACRLLDWTPPVSVARGLKATFEIDNT